MTRLHQGQWRWWLWRMRREGSVSSFVRAKNLFRILSMKNQSCARRRLERLGRNEWKTGSRPRLNSLASLAPLKGQT